MRAAPAVVVLFAVGCAAPPAPPAPEPPAVVRKDRLATPVRIAFDGVPVQAGSPFLGDFDGDGRADLLMGGDTGGRLLVYKTGGAGADLRLTGSQWFDDVVPTGRIPLG